MKRFCFSSKVFWAKILCHLEVLCEKIWFQLKSIWCQFKSIWGKDLVSALRVFFEEHDVSWKPICPRDFLWEQCWHDNCADFGFDNGLALSCKSAIFYSAGVGTREVLLLKLLLLWLLRKELEVVEENNQMRTRVSDRREVFFHGDTTAANSGTMQSRTGT